ncbi:DUF4097 family beta strand repeat-containing protein [Microbacterium sp.]|uniref:DUF4097 family beta strand repeat-containing protein n=1 Tax=Microbacterium sp. TaxID=51671 RepID=UPI002C9A66C7|nr:DUF4097 family beta strand repeat-containing protein [Microbacterium sp.]HWL79191.1 DUF4097 family beta strand repeat-containing protein [Microbacterium sp.]
MSTTLNPPPPATPAGPPPVPGQNPPGGSPQRPPSSAGRVVAILAIVFGSLVIVGAIVSAVVGTIVSASVHTTNRTVEVAGVDRLDIDAAAGSLRVEFGSVREAELEVTSSWGADRWVLERDGGDLVVSSPRMWGPWWIFGGWFGGPGDAVLRLPQSLEGLDADITFSAGTLDVEGEFAELDLTMNAGRADIAGSAESLKADMNAGRADLELADVATANLIVNAGSLDAALTGSQPDEVTVDLSAGSLNLSVPQGDYVVTSDVSAGGFDNRIGSDPSASSTIHVEVSAGQVTLRSR